MFMITQLWLRIFGAGVCFTALIFFVLPMFVGIHHAGCIVGSIVSILGAVFFICNPMIAGKLQQIWGNDTGRIVLCVLIGFLAVSVILAVAISIAMGKAIATKPKEEHPVVVLGCKVRNDGLSLMLLHRMQAAETYLKAHPDVPVILCGGQGNDEPMSEAQAMCNYLTEHGIDKNRIYLDDKSTNTFENLQNAKEVLDENELDYDITIVTDGYHQLRASLIASSLKLKADAVSAKTSWYLVPCYWVREWLGVCYQFIFG
ncbi:MAG: YdcF family protein [Oscillospiraceae bacterium]